MLEQAAGLGAGDQLVDLSADALAGRYSCSHGCRSFRWSCQLFEGTYARRHLHQRMDATHVLAADGATYDELGADYFGRRGDAEARKRYLV